MPLPEYIFAVDAAVDAAVEAAWNKWYDEVHLPEITACPGFRQSARFSIAIREKSVWDRRRGS